MSYNILIVDDSAVAISIIKKIINLSGIPVENLFSAKNGKLALDLIQKHKVDIILTDLNMPVMDGFAFIKNLKKLQGFSDIPVVIVSTEGREDYIIKGIKLGASNYIRKPFKPEQIKDVIIKTLGVAINESDAYSSEECDF